MSLLAFNLLKFAGAAYLIWPGIRMLYRRDPLAPAPTPSAQSARRALVEALNVKTALFFLAFLALARRQS